MTETQLRKLIRKKVDGYGSLRGYAASVGLRPSLISDILTGTKGISDAVAQVFGYREVAQERKYEKIREK
jgi:hypothetical protein